MLHAGLLSSWKDLVSVRSKLSSIVRANRDRKAAGLAGLREISDAVRCDYDAAHSVPPKSPVRGTRGYHGRSMAAWIRFMRIHRAAER